MQLGLKSCKLMKVIGVVVWMHVTMNDSIL